MALLKVAESPAWLGTPFVQLMALDQLPGPFVCQIPATVVSVIDTST